MIFLPEYSILSVEGRDVSFIGMNTSEGFKLANDFLPDEKKTARTYIIKGGPGTGKSTLMKKIAEYFESEGVFVKRYLCSSDPNSLDAVLIDEKVLVIDGTAPHVTEMKYPGACSEAVCLSNFWSAEKLRSRRDEIVRLTDEKNVLYKRLFKLLCSIKSLSDCIKSSSKTFFLEGKAESFFDRLLALKKLPDGESSRYCIRSIGMRGAVRLDSLESKADTVIYIRDYYGISYLILEMIFSLLNRNGKGMIYSVDPLNGQRISDIYLPENKTLFTVSKVQNPTKTVNSERFAEKNILAAERGYLRLAQKCTDELITESKKVLSDISYRHFDLETIYGEAMNFDSICEYTKLLINEISAIIS